MRALYGNREREAAIQNALITRIQARYEKQIRKEIAGRMRKAADMYTQYGDIGVDMAMGGHAGNLEKIFTGLWVLIRIWETETVKFLTGRKDDV